MMARKMNIKIPEELSLLRFGTAPHDDNMGNFISSLSVNHKQIGNLAIQTLFEIHAGNRQVDSEEIINIPINFNEGQTIADAPKM
jgi:DNA-binding LacI/PurR family transcriptional regulator